MASIPKLKNAITDMDRKYKTFVAYSAPKSNKKRLCIKTKPFFLSERTEFIWREAL